jgi:hypothetical protein
MALAGYKSVPCRRFKFQKLSQLFVCADHESLSVAIRANDPDRSSFRING